MLRGAVAGHGGHTITCVAHFNSCAWEDVWGPCTFALCGQGGLRMTHEQRLDVARITHADASPIEGGKPPRRARPVSALPFISAEKSCVSWR